MKILRTTDGGKSFIEQVTVQDRQFSDVWALTRQQVFVAGNSKRRLVSDSGRIVQTANDGATRTDCPVSDSVTSLRKIRFADALHGWMIGEVNDSNGYFGTRSVFFRTTNGGASWKQINKPVIHFSFVDTLRGYAIFGRDDTGLMIGGTNDGGLTWRDLHLADSSVYYDQVLPGPIKFVDSLNGWLFGEVFYQGDSREIILRTSNGGITWHRESLGIAGIIPDATMLDSLHGWAVTLSGEVLGYGVITGVFQSLPEVPSGFRLKQNYPNPFNNSTTIEYEIPKESDVRLDVYDETGKIVSTIVNQRQEAGVYRREFNAEHLSSGVYFYRLDTETFHGTKHLEYIK